MTILADLLITLSGTDGDTGILRWWTCDASFES